MRIQHLAPLALLSVACNGVPRPGALGSSSQGLNTTDYPDVNGSPFPAGAGLSEHIDLRVDGGFTGSQQCVNCELSNGSDLVVDAGHGNVTYVGSTTYIDQGLASLAPAQLADAGFDGGTIYNTIVPAPPFLLESEASDTYSAAVAAAQAALYAPGPGTDNAHSTLDDINTAFETIAHLTGDGQATGVTWNQHQWVKAFKPVYGRNQRYINGPEGITTTYPDPLLLSELTQRGGRSYCAMRTAAANAEHMPNHGADMEMLDDSLAQALFWKVGYAHSDVTLLPMHDEPTPGNPGNRWPTYSDLSFVDRGSEAFYIPVAIGTQVAPLAGPLIPGFGEITHQLAWITGDAEVLDNEDLVTPKSPALSYYAQSYRDLEHYDVWAGNFVDGSTGLDNITLMDLGFFQVMLSVDVSMSSGVLEDPKTPGDTIVSADASKLPWLPEASGGVRYDTFAERTGGLAFSDGLWPVPRQDSFWVSALNQDQSYSLLQPGNDPAFDWAIGLDNSCTAPESPLLPLPFDKEIDGRCSFRPFPDTSQSSGPPTYVEGQPLVPIEWGTAARWHNDDDRSFVLRDSMDVSASVAADADINLGIFSFGLKASASLSVLTTVDTIVREDLGLVTNGNAWPPPQLSGSFAQTSLHLTPLGQNNIVLDPLSVALFFQIGPLPIIGTLQWSVTIFTLGGLGIAGNPFIPNEAARLRVGEFSDETAHQGDATPTYSHLPNGGDFTNPAPESVAECLATDVPVGTAPQPPKTTPAPPADYGLCLVGPLQFPMDLYNDFTSALTGDDDVPTATVAFPTLPPDICKYYAAHPHQANTPSPYTELFDDPQQAECMELMLGFFCGAFDDTESVSTIIQYNALSGQAGPGGQNTVSHKILKQWADAEKVWLGDVSTQCLNAFATSAPGVSGLSSSNINFIGQYFVHSFYNMVICDSEGNPLPGSTPQQGSDHCTPDPKTGQCWSFTPCYENSDGTCNDCQPSETVASNGKTCEGTPVTGPSGGCTPTTELDVFNRNRCPPPPRPECPPGEIPGPTEVGSTYEGPNCVKPPVTCPPGSTLEGAACVMTPPTSLPDGGTCIIASPTGLFEFCSPDAGEPDAGVCTLRDANGIASLGPCTPPDGGEENDDAGPVTVCDSITGLCTQDAGMSSTGCPPGYVATFGDSFGRSSICVPVGDGGDVGASDGGPVEVGGTASDAGTTVDAGASQTISLCIFFGTCDGG